MAHPKKDCFSTPEVVAVTAAYLSLFPAAFLADGFVTWMREMIPPETVAAANQFVCDYWFTSAWIAHIASCIGMFCVLLLHKDTNKLSPKGGLAMVLLYIPFFISTAILLMAEKDESLGKERGNFFSAHPYTLHLSSFFALAMIAISALLYGRIQDAERVPEETRDEEKGYVPPEEDIVTPLIAV